jgi:hypothetical protein
MSGPTYPVHIAEAAIEARPKAWNLTTPASAVQSYLDWTTYAYRIGQSNVAQAVCGSDEGVRVDSYIEYHLENRVLLDQKLLSLQLGTPTTNATSTLVPATEKWTYEYLAADKVNNPHVSGPFEVSYDSTYTVTKQGSNWVVASVKTVSHGTIK